MSFSAGVTNRPQAPVPVYGTPVFPSTLTATAWNPMAAHGQPAVGVAPGVELRLNQQHNASWVSEIPIMANLPVAGSQNSQVRYWGKYLEAYDLVFTLNAPTSAENANQRSKSVQAINLYCMNQGWLPHFGALVRREMQHIRTAQRADPAGGANSLLAQLLQLPEQAWAGRLYDQALVDSELAQTVKGRQLDILHYATACGIERKVTYWGVNYTQSNELKQTDISRGSMSADGNSTQIATVQAGPALVRNVWGPEVRIGKHLWLLLKACGPYNARHFKYVPYVSSELSSEIESHERDYYGITSINGDDKPRYVERARAYYVGQVVGTQGPPVLNQQWINQCAGLEDGISLDDIHHQSERLQLITIRVAPQHFGSFVQFA